VVVVERADADVLAPLLLQLHMLADEADDVRRVKHALAVVVGERSALGQSRDARERGAAREQDDRNSRILRESVVV